MKLSSMPSFLGFTYQWNGYFHHQFSSEESLQYIGPSPPLTDYSVDCMAQGSVGTHGSNRTEIKHEILYLILVRSRQHSIQKGQNVKSKSRSNRRMLIPPLE